MLNLIWKKRVEILDSIACAGLGIVMGLVLFVADDTSVYETERVVREEPIIGVLNGDVLHDVHNGAILRNDNFSSDSSVLCRNRFDTLDKVYVQEDSEEQIKAEIEDGECEMLAQLIEAEAGNQDYIGKCLVADVVLNRVRSNEFPNDVESVIFQYLKDSKGKKRYQFSTIVDGAYDKAAWNISEDSFKAAYQEYHAERRVDDSLLSFTAGSYNPYFTPAYVHGDHYFGR